MNKGDKIEALATRRVSGEFRVEKFPTVSQFVSDHGLKEGLRLYDEATERWRVNLEKAINERGPKSPEVSTSTG